MGQSASEIDHDGTRVLVVDDHPALQAGLEGLLNGEADMRCVGVVDDPAKVADAVRQTRPHVVVLDYALGDSDGLSLCFRLKQQVRPPGVVLYTAYADGPFAVPAAVAQADAVVAKHAAVEELLSTIRHIAGGNLKRPLLSPEIVEAASARLRAEDLPVAGMLLGAVPVGDIARILDLSIAEVRSRGLRIIGRLQAGYRVRRPLTAQPDDDAFRAAIRGTEAIHDGS